MKIIDIVKFNDHIGLVVDEIPQIVYEEYGKFLIGSDDKGVLFNCLVYERPIGVFKAFGGREFDLPMKDGSVTHCYGQYWHDTFNNASKVLGFKLASITIQTLDDLKKCYVFVGYQAKYETYYKAVSDFLNNHPNYKIWGYREYEKHITNKPIELNHRDKVSESFQNKVRKMFNCI